MKFKLLYLFIFTAFLFVSCSKDDNSDQIQHEDWVLEDYLRTFYPNAQPTASGLYIMCDNKGTGITPSADDYILFNYTLRYAETRNIFDTSWKSVATDLGIAARTSISFNGPLKVKLSSMYAGMREALMSMQEGDSARLIIPSSLFKNDYNPIVADITLIKVIPNPVQFEKEQLAQFLKDSCNLTLADSTKTDFTGIYIDPNPARTVEGTGNLPADTSEVTVKYSLFFLPYADGKYLNLGSQAIESNSLTFTINDAAVIEGFLGAVKRMKKGGKMRVILPYTKSYGEFRYPLDPSARMTVPPYTTLIYDLELTEMK
jgi:FKBP-type peptidyl-prolyl cis-trans isomerase